MNVESQMLERGAARAHARPVRPVRSRAWAIVGALSITETVSWGILYYAFAAFLVPMRAELGLSTAELTGAFSLGLLVAGVAGIPVGRYLDRHSPRPLMTSGSIAGVALVVAWSQVDGLAAFYALWVAIGLVMAAVLYEPAFTVLAKHFPIAEQRRRAMTAMTLVAALASFIFLPLTQALIDAHGWRDALLILAAILAVITIPLHALVLRRAPRASQPHVMAPSVPAGDALRSGSFWLLSAAFFLASVAGLAMMVHSIPFLVERGHSAAFAAFAVGLVGISQIPGRLLFAPLAALLPAPAATASLFVLIAAGIAVLVTVHATWAVVVGLVLLGMGNGMSTLARATSIADLFGSGAYGAIASVAAFLTTAARAVGPVAAAVYAAAFGYVALLWTLVGITVVAAALAYRAVD
ncbi:MAG TPA: MFS transporter [Solirubrobacteraceae bacterium]|nr:MFS transporter [Solirubrobacteraceae bacterium]